MILKLRCGPRKFLRMRERLLNWCSKEAELPAWPGSSWLLSLGCGPVFGGAMPRMERWWLRCWERMCSSPPSGRKRVACSGLRSWPCSWRCRVPFSGSVHPEAPSPNRFASGPVFRASLRLAMRRVWPHGSWRMRKTSRMRPGGLFHPVPSARNSIQRRKNSLEAWHQILCQMLSAPSCA